MPANPSPGALERIFGSSKKRTKDIELPNESGQVDPRLKKKRSIFGKFNPLDKLFDKVEAASEKKK